MFKVGKRLRRWGAGLALVCALICLVLFGAVKWLLPRYLASQDFQKRLSERMAGLIDAPGSFSSLRWQDSTAHSDGFLARGYPGRSLQELRARDLTARFDWRGLWQRQAIVEEFTIEHLQAAFSDETAKELEQDPPDPPVLQAPLKKSSTFNVDLRKVVVHRATVLWGTPAEDYGAFREVALCLWPDGKDLAAYGAGGTFQLGELPQAEVRPFQLRYVKPNLAVEWGSLTLGGESEVTVSGQFQYTQPSQMDLHLGFRRCPVAPFLKPEMRAKFDGTFESDTRVRQEQEKPARFEGPVRFKGATLKNVEGMAKLAAFTHEPRFKMLHFQTLHGNYTYAGSELCVDELVAEVPGLFQVEGSLTVDDKKLHGAVQLGVAAKVLESFPGAREEVFTKRRNDYYWTTVQLSGTTDEPQHDLKERLLAAAKKHPIKAIAPPAAKALDLIGKPVKSLLEKLKELF